MKGEIIFRFVFVSKIAKEVFHMTVEEKINNLRYRLEKFRQGLSVRESIVGDGQSLIASKKNSNSVQEFDAILSELNEIVIRQLERLYYWDEIENILVLIVENRVGIDLADRKQYARDIISFGKSEESTPKSYTGDRIRINYG